MIKQKNTNTHPIETIYKEHIDLLYSYALNLGFDKHTAMDAIHDVLYKICMKNEAYYDIKNLKFYLLRSLKNRLLDITRSTKKEVLLSADTDFEDLPFKVKISVEDLLIDEEESQRVKEKIDTLLNSLSNRQREIIYLRFTEEFDYPQIAQIMNISIPSCRKLLHKALTELRNNKEILSSILLVMSALE